MISPRYLTLRFPALVSRVTAFAAKRVSKTQQIKNTTEVIRHD